MEDRIDRQWRTSSYTGNGGGNCVETASGNGAVMVRDTKDRVGGTLAFSAEAWRTFTRKLK